MQHQTATFWRAGGTDKNGALSLAAPVLLDVRWEDRQVKAISAKGEEFTSQAVVWYDGDKLPIGSYLALGDYSATIDPRDGFLGEDAAHPIRASVFTPSIRNVSTERRYIL